MEENNSSHLSLHTVSHIVPVINVTAPATNSNHLALKSVSSSLLIFPLTMTHIYPFWRKKNFPVSVLGLHTKTITSRSQSC